VIDKCVPNLRAALADIKDGSVVMIGGFGTVGQPAALVEALIDQGARDLTIVANNAGTGHEGLAKLMEQGRVRRVICTFPRQAGSIVFEELYSRGAIELEVVPQGTLAERIRAAGAGIPAFFTPTTVGTVLSKGKELREIGGRSYVLEYALNADVALVEAWRGDRWGNLCYRGSGQNFNPPMATAATLTIAQVDMIVPLGALEPDKIHTPGIFVNRVVQVQAA
jgi:3-oxoadipate CoA-transferase alpha subunit